MSDALQRVRDGGAVTVRGAAEEAHMAVAAHHHHILDEHGERPVHLFRLWDVGDEIAPERLPHRLAENADLAPAPSARSP